MKIFAEKFQLKNPRAARSPIYGPSDLAHHSKINNPIGGYLPGTAQLD